MNKKEQFINNGGKEEDYEKHVQSVCEKRQFNIKTAKLLNVYGFDVCIYLNDAKIKYGKKAQADLLTPQEYANWIISDCACPLTILEHYESLGSHCAEDFTKDGVIANHFNGMPEWCWLRWGDRNTLDKTIRKNYINDDSIALDVKCIELTETAGFDVSEQDVIDFCTAFPKGNKTYKTYRDKVADRFKQVAGFNIDDSFATKMLSFLNAEFALSIAALKSAEDEDMPF
jgi:hypothetical protein